MVARGDEGYASVDMDHREIVWMPAVLTSERVGERAGLVLPVSDPVSLTGQVRRRDPPKPPVLLVKSAVTLDGTGP